MGSKLKIGERAPDFTLIDSEMRPRSLREFLGQPVVLAFFPGAFTPVCTKEMCAFRDSLAKLNALKARVVGISVNDPFSNKAFAQKNMLSFPIVCDYNREVVKLYGVELADFAGLKGYVAAKRSVFVLDKDGIISYVWTSEDPRVEPNYAEIEKTLEGMA